MLHQPETTPLSEFVNLDERSQAHVLHALQQRSVAGDAASNIRLLFAEALQVVASLAASLSSSSSTPNISGSNGAENATSTSTR